MTEAGPKAGPERVVVVGVAVFVAERAEAVERAIVVVAVVDVVAAIAVVEGLVVAVEVLGS